VPFTLAHPAAILPLRGRHYLRTAPLIIGAMAPDLPYFLPSNLERHVPEIEACIRAACGVDADVAFVPHSGPFARGTETAGAAWRRARWTTRRRRA